MRRTFILGLVVAASGALILPSLIAGIGDASKDVTLREVLASPTVYQDIPIRLKCIFHKIERFDMPFYTKYTSQSYIALSAWPDDARLWEKAEHVRDHPLFFVDRQDEVAGTLLGLSIYEPVEVRGTITSSFGDLPWIEVSSIESLDVPSFTEGSLRHLVLGLDFVEQGKFDTASEELESATQFDVPENALLLAFRKLGHCYHMLKDYRKAAEYYSKAERLAPGDKEIEGALESIKREEEEARRVAGTRGVAAEGALEKATADELTRQLEAKQREIEELVKANEELVAELDNKRIENETLVEENEELIDQLKTLAQPRGEEPVEGTESPEGGEPGEEGETPEVPAEGPGEGVGTVPSDEVGELSKKLSDAEARLAEKEKTIEELTEKAASAGFEIDVMNLADVFARLVGDVEAANGRADALASAVAARDERIGVLEAAQEVAISGEEAENLRAKVAEFESLVAERDELATKHDSLGKELAVAKEALAKADEDREALKQQLTAKEQENNELAGKLSGMAQKEQELKELEKKLGDSQALVDEIESFKKQRSEMEARMQRVESENQTLKDEVEKLEQEKERILAAGGGEAGALQAQLVEYEEALSERDAELGELKGEVEKVRGELEEAQSAFEEFKAATGKDVAELVADYKEIEKNLASKVKEADELGNTLGELIKKQQAERAREAKAETEIEEAKKAIGELEARLAQAPADEKEGLEKMLAEERARLDDLRKFGVERLRGEYNRVAGELEHEKQVTAELQSQMESMRKEVEELKRKLGEPEGEEKPAEDEGEEVDE